MRIIIEYDEEQRRPEIRTESTVKQSVNEGAIEAGSAPRLVMEETISSAVSQPAESVEVEGTSESGDTIDAGPAPTELVEAPEEESLPEEDLDEWIEAGAAEEPYRVQ